MSQTQATKGIHDRAISRRPSQVFPIFNFASKQHIARLLQLPTVNQHFSANLIKIKLFTEYSQM